MDLKNLKVIHIVRKQVDFRIPPIFCHKFLNGTIYGEITFRLSSKNMETNILTYGYFGQSKCVLIEKTYFTGSIFPTSKYPFVTKTNSICQVNVIIKIHEFKELLSYKYCSEVNFCGG